MNSLIAALLLTFHASAVALDLDRKLLDGRSRQLLDRAEEVRTVLIQPTERASNVVLLARIPSTAGPGTGFCAR